MAARVLIADDDAVVRDVVRRYLERDGLEVRVAGDGNEALRVLGSERIDVAVLDVMMPGPSGLSLCRTLRQGGDYTVPVILLTALSEEDDRIAGLEAGADDYLTKPFSPRELVLRLRLLINKSRTPPGEDIFRAGPFEFDRGAFEVRLGGRKLDLTALEFKLFAALFEKRGRVLDRETLLRDVWGYRNLANSRTVDTHVRRLRGKLRPHDDRIETVHGEGYRFRVGADD